jgi:hypothetical protein
MNGILLTHGENRAPPNSQCTPANAPARYLKMGIFFASFSSATEPLIAPFS